MFVDLKIPSRFVPAEVTLENLKKYDDSMRAEIEETYQRLKAARFAKASKDGANVTAIFGSHGTGVRTLMKNLKSETAGPAPVNLNAELFATALPSFTNDGASLENRGYGIGDQEVDAIIQGITARYLPAGKYMHDRMMEEALEEGHSVIITKRGRTNGGVKLVKAFIDAGIPVHTILYQAPLSLKLEAAAIPGSISISQEEVIAEHKTMTSSMMELAKLPTDLLSIYYRVKEGAKVDGNAHLVASGDKKTFSVYDETLAGVFNSQFKMDATVENLMKVTDRTQVHFPQTFTKGFTLESV